MNIVSKYGLVFTTVSPPGKLPYGKTFISCFTIATSLIISINSILFTELQQMLINKFTET